MHDPLEPYRAQFFKGSAYSPWKYRRKFTASFRSVAFAALANPTCAGDLLRGFLSKAELFNLPGLMRNVPVASCNYFLNHIKQLKKMFNLIPQIVSFINYFY